MQTMSREKFNPLGERWLRTLVTVLWSMSTRVEAATIRSDSLSIPQSISLNELQESIHEYDRYVLNFRREHNFALVSGISRGVWRISRFKDLKDEKFPSNGFYGRFQYSFHLPIYQSFGYLLGSGAGFIYESSRINSEFRPVSAWQYPGVLLGLVYNYSSVIRLATTAEAYLERHEGLRTQKTSIHVTSNVFDFGVSLDIFYDLTMALRIEYHERELLYEKPFIPQETAEIFDVDARIGKKDKTIAAGLVYHLI
jgi:hypothetical protein